MGVAAVTLNVDIYCFERADLDKIPSLWRFSPHTNN